MIIRVLIADDHGMVAEALRVLIDAHPDIQVVGLAENGRDAVRLAHERRADVVVMDNVMPVMSGTEAARMITERGTDIRVVMLSMHSDLVHVQRAFQAGASGYVLKRSAPHELLTAIRAVHAGRRFVGAPLGEQMIDLIVSDGPEDPLSLLTSRERQILKMLAEGRGARETAGALALSPKTVETYRSRLMGKLGLHNMAELVKFAIQQGLVPLE